MCQRKNCVILHKEMESLFCNMKTILYPRMWTRSKKGWDKIEAFMRDAGQRRKYEQREKYEHDYVSDMEGSWKEGREAGVKQGRREGRQLGIAHIAMNMLRAGTPIAIVAQMAELPEAVIRKIAEEHGLQVT